MSGCWVVYCWNPGPDFVAAYPGTDEGELQARRDAMPGGYNVTYVEWGESVQDAEKRPAAGPGGSDQPRGS